MNSIETLLDCSMWCGTPETQGLNLIYRFSDVNRGKPTNFCYDAMKEGLNTYAHIIGIAAFIASGFLFVMCMCNIFICCHPSRRDMSLRQRFTYMREGEYARV